MLEKAHRCGKRNNWNTRLRQQQSSGTLPGMVTARRTVPRPRAAARPAPRAVNARVLQELSLRYFIEVVHAGSVTEAAARLDVAPSAVSRQIARLERELDTLLFERKARGMTLNAAGELLAAHARRAWLDVEQVTAEILALRGLRTGKVRLISTEGFAYEFLPTLVASFEARWSGIRFSLAMCAQPEVVRRVREGEADIGVTVGMRSEHGLAVEVRHPAPVLAVMAPGHPLANRRQLSLAQVVAHPLALPAPSSTLRQLLEVSCSRQGLPCEPQFTSEQLYPLVHYAAATHAVTFCGEMALRLHLAQGLVKAIPLRDREMNERHFEVHTLAGRQLPDAARAFIEHLKQHLDDTP
jgi:DNA-binding transcriptional LysR family regulator